MQEDQEETVESIMKKIASNLPMPCEAVPGFGSGLEIRVISELAWGVGATLLVRSEDEGGGRFSILVEVNAGSTVRSPVEAIAFAHLYEEFAQAACLAEAIHRGKHYPLAVDLRKSMRPSPASDPEKEGAPEISQGLCVDPKEREKL